MWCTISFSRTRLVIMLLMAVVILIHPCQIRLAGIVEKEWVQIPVFKYDFVLSLILTLIWHLFIVVHSWVNRLISLITHELFVESFVFICNFVRISLVTFYLHQSHLIFVFMILISPHLDYIITWYKRGLNALIGKLLIDLFCW